jgi:hypothetical protein
MKLQGLINKVRDVWVDCFPFKVSQDFEGADPAWQSGDGTFHPFAMTLAQVVDLLFRANELSLAITANFVIDEPPDDDAWSGTSEVTADRTSIPLVMTDLISSFTADGTSWAFPDAGGFSYADVAYSPFFAAPGFAICFGSSVSPFYLGHNYNLVYDGSAWWPSLFFYAGGHYPRLSTIAEAGRFQCGTFTLDGYGSCALYAEGGGAAGPISGTCDATITVGTYDLPVN